MSDCALSAEGYDRCFWAAVGGGEEHGKELERSQIFPVSRAREPGKFVSARDLLSR